MYDLEFTERAERAVSALESTERMSVHQKLNRIATSRFRHPTEWDFKRMPGQSDGRLRLPDGLRAFVDINEQTRVIRINYIGRRENLYT